MSVQTFAATGINLFILSFDNYQNDPEIDWLREGFVDFLMDYFRSNPDVNVQRTTAINATLDKIRRTPDLQTARNYILTGNFQRVNDQFEVNLQLTDINTWKTTEQQKIVEKPHDLAKVIEVVNQSAAGLIDPTLRPIGKGDAESSVRLEQRWNLFARQLPPPKRSSSRSKIIRHLFRETQNFSPTPKALAQQPNEGINAADFSRRLNESVAQSSSFAEILRRICSNPYKIEISDPEFSRVTLNDEMIKISSLCAIL
jgi:TolB-like protein